MIRREKKGVDSEIEFRCDFCGEGASFVLHLGKFACPKHGKTRQQVFDEANQMMNSGVNRRDWSRLREKEEESDDEEEEVVEKEVKKCFKCGKSVLSFKANTRDGGICSTCYQGV